MRSEEPTVLAESGIPSSADAEVKGDASDLVSSSLRRLLDETSDLIDSPTANTVMNQMLNAAFSFFLDAKLTDNAFKPKATALPPARAYTDENQVQVLLTREEAENAATTKFASVLAVLTRQAHLIGNGLPNENSHNGVPNEYLQVCVTQLLFFQYFSLALGSFVCNHAAVGT